MRGPATQKRFGIIPNSLLNWLLKKERIRKNLHSQIPSIITTRIVGIFDIVRERILKPIYRSLPVSFKIWYDKVRYHV